MNKFKVGDKVRLISNEAGSINRTGHIGLVTEVGLREYRVGPTDSLNWSLETDLMLVGISDESAQTTKAEYLIFLDQTFDDMKKLIQAKQSDYTSNSDDPFANFRSSDEFGVDPLLGVFLRMSDKFQRIKSFSKAGKLEVAGEGVDDALKDIIGYSLISLALLKEKPDGNNG